MLLIVRDLEHDGLYLLHHLTQDGVGGPYIRQYGQGGVQEVLVQVRVREQSEAGEHRSNLQIQNFVNSCKQKQIIPY